MRVAGKIALVALLALGLCASAASAAPLSMTFTEDRANVGDQLTDAPMFQAPDTAPLAAQIDPGSGSITGGELQVPAFNTHIETPVSADVTVEFEIGIITGSFTEATGALTLTGTAGGTLTANGEECTVSTPGELTLSTAGSGGRVPHPGSPFSAGLAGPGAIAGEWSDMSATPVDSGDSADVQVCGVVEEHIEGPGGIWLDQKGKVVPPPQLPGPACTVPKLAGKKLAQARTALAAAGCKLGTVHRPKRHKGKRRRPLVVKSSSPSAGARSADGIVDLRLGSRPRKAHR